MEGVKDGRSKGWKKGRKRRTGEMEGKEGKYGNRWKGTEGRERKEGRPRKVER